jgi:hypothetical protein
VLKLHASQVTQPAPFFINFPQTIANGVCHLDENNGKDRISSSDDTICLRLMQVHHYNESKDE